MYICLFVLLRLRVVSHLAGESHTLGNLALAVGERIKSLDVLVEVGCMMSEVRLLSWKERLPGNLMLRLTLPMVTVVLSSWSSIIGINPIN